VSSEPGVLRGDKADLDIEQPPDSRVGGCQAVLGGVAAKWLITGEIHSKINCTHKPATVEKGYRQAILLILRVVVLGVAR
jgi:hypothetical protein